MQQGKINTPRPTLAQLLVVLGKNLRTERERKGYSQERFAEIAGFHRTYIGLVERGEQNITIQSYSKFAEALDMSIYELMQRTLLDFSPRHSMFDVTRNVVITDFEEAMFSSLNELVFIIGMDGKIVYSNFSVTHKLGYVPEELISKPLFEVHPEVCRDEIDECLYNILNGISSYCSVPFKTKSGSIVPVESRVYHGFWDKSPVVCNVCRELSV
jgi:PAS domain S-box-containing protein